MGNEPEIRPFLFFEDPARSSKKKGKGIQILVSPSQTSIYVMCPTDHDIYIQVQIRLVVSDIWPRLRGEHLIQVSRWEKK